LICLSGVVDPRLKIYGLANVRVVDASVIPLTTGVAIQSTVYAIAEKV
jgi:choline dehydrogenase-like flavoprotein